MRFLRGPQKTKRQGDEEKATRQYMVVRRRAFDEVNAGFLLFSAPTH